MRERRVGEEGRKRTQATWGHKTNNVTQMSSRLGWTRSKKLGQQINTDEDNPGLIEWHKGLMVRTRDLVLGSAFSQSFCRLVRTIMSLQLKTLGQFEVCPDPSEPVRVDGWQVYREQRRLFVIYVTMRLTEGKPLQTLSPTKHAQSKRLTTGKLCVRK